MSEKATSIDGAAAQGGRATSPTVERGKARTGREKSVDVVVPRRQKLCEHGWDDYCPHDCAPEDFT